MSDESLKAYLQTREWHWISAGIGAFSGLLTGLFFWMVSPFDFTHSTYWLIILGVMLVLGTAGYFLKSHRASRLENAILWVVAIFGFADMNS